MTATRRAQRGFTLAEVLIAMAMLALLMVAAAMAVQAASSSRAYNAEKTDLVAMARGVLDRISRDVRLALSFEVPDSHSIVISMPNGLTHTYAWDGADGGNLTYTVTEQSVDPYGNVIENSTSMVLTEQVRDFETNDSETPSCGLKILLAGDLATAEATITATPRKAVY